MPKAICVYCSSSNSVDPHYFDVARELGKNIAVRQDSLIYGGASVGLMGETASSVKKNGGKVVGIIPESIYGRGLAFEDADEMVVTKGMRERKAEMESRGDAFIALPGGFGTLEEVLEMITLKQLHYHDKPIVLLNSNGFYSSLIDVFEHLFETKFAREVYRDLYHIAGTVDATFTYIDNYQAPDLGTKWT